MLLPPHLKNVKLFLSYWFTPSLGQERARKSKKGVSPSSPVLPLYFFMHQHHHWQQDWIWFQEKCSLENYRSRARRGSLESKHCSYLFATNFKDALKKKKSSTVDMHKGIESGIVRTVFLKFHCYAKHHQRVECIDLWWPDFREDTHRRTAQSSAFYCGSHPFRPS